MQFFIIHQDPETNAKMLPDYAIKQVNVREGWQILSDIGHNLGITWEGQNKPYSIWHAETRRFMVNREAFSGFYDHYNHCLTEYMKRFNKSTVFHDRFYKMDYEAIYKLLESLPENRTHEQFMLDYMLRGKRDKMTDEEIQRLEDIK